MTTNVRGETRERSRHEIVKPRLAHRTAGRTGGRAARTDPGSGTAPRRVVAPAFARALRATHDRDPRPGFRAVPRALTRGYAAAPASSGGSGQFSTAHTVRSSSPSSTEIL